MTQTSIGIAAGISSSMVGKLVRGESRGSSHLVKIARALRTSPEYLIGEIDDPDRDTLQVPTADDLAEQMGLIKVEEIDLALGMGASYLDESAIQSVTKWIPEDWVRQFTDAPGHFLTIARPTGDSMYPTINDRDIILIDRSSKSIDRQEAIWALNYGGLGTVKRVRAMPDGSYKLMADNPQVREEMAVDGELFVMGRVVGVLRRT